MTHAPRRVPPAAVRLGVAALLGVTAAALVPGGGGWPPVARTLLGWDVLCLAVLLGVWLVLLKAGPARTRRLATREDDTRTLARLVTVAAALVSLLGVGLALWTAHQRPVWELPLTALAALTTVLSWLLLHTEYALHYARLYYETGGGIVFLEGSGTLQDPDYRDFLYLSFTIGMTYQVSDTNLTSRPMRRLLLGHALVSYLFGTVVVALTVGGVASLLG
ncbi:hypothetical protein RDMS_04300 [Deinococcus sp. RL]|uniref:DUF1345 domain-containing protein n=1 Tax=Deinococcus sp. RL TaxID=1489678 RepID=UPI0004D7DDC5|nr:DUF1345 domain-containing protein [Deinococcus sp. RL]KEF35025.1 hypothetical protein RDMS_04300 [Deinococcus sp. RL]